MLIMRCAQNQAPVGIDPSPRIMLTSQEIVQGGS